MLCDEAIKLYPNYAFAYYSRGIGLAILNNNKEALESFNEAIKCDPKDALAYIKQRRPIANPNFGFIQQLHEYGRDQLGQRLEVPRV